MESLPEPDSELLLFPVSEPEPEFPSLVPALPVASLEVLLPFLSLAFTSLLSLTLSAGIVTLPVFSSTFTPSGVFSPFHLPSLPFLTVMVFGVVSFSGV